jgi:hypothetical protein
VDSFFMMRLRSLSTGVVAALLAVLLSQCSAASLSHADGGPGYDAEAPDAPVDAVLACGPLDVAGFNPQTMHPPNPPHAGKCTLQQSQDFAACESGDTSKCAQFSPGQPAEACGACIDTHASDATWGVVVFDGQIGTVNIEGCVDDALGEVSQEKASGGSGSCGDLLHASYGCQDAACSACTGDELTSCISSAVAGGCATYASDVQSPNGPCDLLLGDAAPPDVVSCFPDPSIGDLAAQRTDFLTRIANYMCGPQT